jgi:small subunit ribosomal protein S5
MSASVRVEEDQLQESLVHVNRVTKVVKGGRKFSFAACVVAGDKSGLVGYGHGKAKEVLEARAKAAHSAKRDLIKVSLYQGRTIHHDVTGRSGASSVILRRAKPGTGIIAGGPMRAVLDLLGVHDIVAKSLGSRNVYTMIAATFDALKKLSTPKSIALMRDKSIGDIYTVQVKE